MKTKFRNITGAMAFMVIAALLAVPLPAEAARGGGGAPAVTVVYVGGANGLNPADPSWNQAAAATIEFKHINYVDTGCGSGTLYEMRPVTVRAVHNGTSIFFRFDWSDATADLTVADPNLFADAVALEVPINGVGGEGGSTTIMMGSQNNPVNIIM